MVVSDTDDHQQQQQQQNGEGENGEEAHPDCKYNNHVLSNRGYDYGSIKSTPFRPDEIVLEPTACCGTQQYEYESVGVTVPGTAWASEDGTEHYALAGLPCCSLDRAQSCAQ